MEKNENGADLKSAAENVEKKLFIETYGCQMNVADSEVVASVMQMAGYEMTEEIQDADAIFVNTCSVRDNAEQKVLGRLQYFQSLKRKKKRTSACSLQIYTDKQWRNQYHCPIILIRLWQKGFLR